MQWRSSLWLTRWETTSSAVLQALRWNRASEKGPRRRKAREQGGKGEPAGQTEMLTAWVDLTCLLGSPGLKALLALISPLYFILPKPTSWNVLDRNHNTSNTAWALLKQVGSSTLGFFPKFSDFIQFKGFAFYCAGTIWLGQLVLILEFVLSNTPL